MSALIHTVTLAAMPPNYPRSEHGIQQLLRELRLHSFSSALHLITTPKGCLANFVA